MVIVFVIFQYFKDCLIPIILNQIKSLFYDWVKNYIYNCNYNLMYIILFIYIILLYIIHTSYIRIYMKLYVQLIEIITIQYYTILQFWFVCLIKDFFLFWLIVRNTRAFNILYIYIYIYISNILRNNFLIRVWTYYRQELQGISQFKE